MCVKLLQYLTIVSIVDPHSAGFHQKLISLGTADNIERIDIGWFDRNPNVTT
ncbi:hypothetical protein [Peribacillus sp. Bi96]|uniref:hypothetical protein n=1 Tax=Peribacillus sp. Bi96 TaxID=2884273 RepID=UPI001E30C0B3|nr:hypothetical protein [Peribacillus sp. Bi96]